SRPAPTTRSVVHANAKSARPPPARAPARPPPPPPPRRRPPGPPPRHDWISNHVRHFPDIHEAWDLPSTAFDRLIKALTERLPPIAGELRGPVVLLSGDVHTSFASRLLYKATARIEDAEKQPATAVVAQLVASSWRKQTEETLGQQVEGYTYSPHWYVSPMIGPHVTEYYAGWILPPGTKVKVFRIANAVDFMLDHSA